MQKIKATPAHTERWNTTEVHQSWWKNDPASNVVTTYSGGYNFTYPANVIAYDIGPKYIGNPKHCNWKACTHSGFQSQFDNAGYHCQYLRTPNRGGTCDQYDAYGINPFGISLPFPSASMPDPVDETDLARKMYADLAGRVDQYFLSLESLAGLISGQSLLKAIGGTANATNMLAKAIRDLKKLRAAFGRKASLYNMWLSSKELVRQILGLDLGYRFSFKATLSDIDNVVSAVAGLQQDIQRLSFRNDGRLHAYVKNYTASETTESTISGSDFRNAFIHAFPVSPNPLSNLPAGEVPAATLRSTNTMHARLYTWARVSYPSEYISTKRLLQSRFGLDKPLSTLWAIVPCSFIIDYLIRVQDTLESLDNQLNEYSVAIDLKDAWLVTSTKSIQEVEWPGIVYSGRTGSSSFIISCPPMHASRTLNKYFERRPFPSASIMSSVGSLFRTDSERWTTRIGTGLELLLTRRLR